jgi:tetratricopeptide (TPR) repeat protein
MEEREQFPRIPVSDALVRMETVQQSLLSEAGAAPDPLLTLEYYKLKWQIEAAGSASAGRRALVDVWFLLEQYPGSEPLNEYAVWLFLTEGKLQEAGGIFEKWFYAKYGVSGLSGLSLGNEAAELVSTVSWKDLEGWEAEYYALLLSLTGKTADASVLLERLSDDGLRGWRSLVNLAYLNEAAKNYTRAFELYGTAAGLTMDRREKSRIHYRIGRLYVERRDFSHARVSLSYSLSLDPDNYEARLLLKRYQ